VLAREDRWRWSLPNSPRDLKVSTSPRSGQVAADGSLLGERRLGHSRDYIGQIFHKDGKEKAVDGRVLSGLRIVHLHCRATLVDGFPDLPRLEKARRRVRLNDHCRPCALFDDVLRDIGVGGKLGSRSLKVPQAGLVKLGTRSAMVRASTCPFASPGRQ
jgi:hypothetical protein